MNTVTVFVLLTVLNVVNVYGHEDHITNTLKTVIDNQEDLIAKLNEISQENRQYLKTELNCFQNKIIEGQREIKSMIINRNTEDIPMFEDVDECSLGTADCSVHASCTNTIGSYDCTCNGHFQGDGRHCSCPQGFEMKGSSCEDINECSLGTSNCSSKAICSNTIGGYDCMCMPPFKGDGRMCIEFPCNRDTFYDGLGCLLFIEERKTFHEMKHLCQSVGGRLVYNFDSRSMHSIKRNFPTDLWVGVEDGKWIISGEPTGYDLWADGYPSGPSGRCGYISSDADNKKLNVRDCTQKLSGLCQKGREEL